MTWPRVAVVAPSLDILGGQSVQARILMEGLTGEGCPVSFVPIDPSFPSVLRRVRRVPYLRTAVNQSLYVPGLSRLRGADVIHIFSASYWSFLLGPVPALVAARLLGKRAVLNYHSGEAQDHLARWGGLVHPWLRLADEIVVPSEYLRGVFARHGYRTRVVRNVVDVSRFAYRDRASASARLLSARNLERYYRVDTIIEAFALVRRHCPEATLTIAGFGSEEPHLRRLANRVAADAVRFVGRVRPAAMPALYDGCDVFVNTSEVDNQPLSILEAFASGLPVVSTPTGDLASMVRDGERGLLVPPDDPGALAQAVVRLLQNRDLARRLARAARAEVEEHSWLRCRDRWRAVYQGEAP